MSGWTKTQRYECHSGCSLGGCPGHNGTLTYHGASDAYQWTDDRTDTHYFDLNEIQALLELANPYFEEPQ